MEKELQESTADSSNKTTSPEPKGFESLEKTLETIIDHEVTESCAKHGDYQSQRMYISGELALATTCPICQRIAGEEKAERVEAARIKKVAADKKRRFETRIREANIPLRFENATFETYIIRSTAQNNNLIKCLDYANNFTPGVGMLLCGTTGTGKTHLAIAVVRRVIAQDSSAMYGRTAQMLQEVKSTYNKSSEVTQGEVIKKYTAPDLLVLDEIGVQFGTDTEKQILFEILNSRYEQVKSTILVSNLAVKGVEEFIGARLVDRMKEGGGEIVVFNWESQRK